MTQDRLRKNRLRKNEEPSAEDGQVHVVRSTRLEDIPIEDALHEKELFEKGEDARKLNPKYSPGLVVVSPDVRSKRIIEVYKRCFDESGKSVREKVIRDFVAHFSYLVFDADWLKELVWTQFALPAYADEGKKEILLAIANGFRGAASNKKQEPTIQKSYRLQGANHVRHTLQKELSTWNEALQRSVSDPREVAASVSQKSEEIAKKYRNLGRRHVPRLRRMLQQGQCYETAVLIASRLFNVRARDLQDKPQ